MWNHRIFSPSFMSSWQINDGSRALGHKTNDAESMTINSKSLAINSNNNNNWCLSLCTLSSHQIAIIIISFFPMDTWEKFFTSTHLLGGCMGRKKPTYVRKRSGQFFFIFILLNLNLNLMIKVINLYIQLHILFKKVTKYLDTSRSTYPFKFLFFFFYRINIDLWYDSDRSEEHTSELQSRN